MSRSLNDDVFAEKDGNISNEVVVASVPPHGDGDEAPTEAEFHTLRRVPDKIPWRAYTIAFVELCERFSYYGTTVVCMYSTTLTLDSANYSSSH